jgi:hypothetical protein
MMGDPWATYDAWLEGPATDGHDEPCEFCEDDEGCGRCDKQIADDLRWSTDPRV